MVDLPEGDEAGHTVKLVAIIRREGTEEFVASPWTPASRTAGPPKQICEYWRRILVSASRAGRRAWT